MRDEKRAETSATGCRECRAALPSGQRGRPAVYCSRSCQARAYRRRRNPPVPAPVEARADPTDPGPPDARARKRRLVAEAVWRIAAERGLHAASMREIAAEAGVSLRVVQYHFTNKHHLLVFALRLLHEDNDREARSRLPSDLTDPRALLRAVIDEFLPLDERRAAALRVFAAYYARSLTDPELAAVFLHDEQPLERLVAGLITAGAGPDAAAAGLDPRHEADLLVSGATGLGMDVVHGRRTLADVRDVLDYHVGRILGQGTGSNFAINYRVV
ncbi:TetR/AcrR family transcriptional regulator [Streptomyces sp. NPDC059002]|uniref:TetR/AcrR family transcriptional regulator n=1 Tax=Streptomyces sp. NPDC059002 TaxID=3346690 RepID=UPI00369CD8B0